MKQKEKLLGYYNYTVILTYVGLLIGFTGICFAINDNYFASLLCLMLAGTCDMFDGTVAATRERTAAEKHFGIQIDSLSDLICFGVLPATVVYCMNERRIFALLAAAFYVLCALIRLAYFNVDEQERQLREDGPRAYYRGMPVTLSALILPVVYEVGGLLPWRTRLIEAIVLVAMAVAFVLPFRLKKPHLIGKLCMALCGALVFFLLFFVGADAV